MTAYYNENDSYAAQWLRNLINAGHLAGGYVDERDIRDVEPDDLRNYDQCHFFAGIGGWGLALRMAGWTDNTPVWTGSCPCQPFSAAGNQQGFDDSRHLWPAWARLIRGRHPSVIFGEQVKGAIKLGWLDLVFDELEKEGYACGARILPACSVGAPHIRDRLWFVADSSSAGLEKLCIEPTQPECETAERSGCSGELGQPHGARPSAGRESTASARHWNPTLSANWHDRELADSESEQPHWSGDARQRRRKSSDGGFWSDPEWLRCTDGKARPTQPGIFPLAHGVPARVAKLRAAGNAIVPQVAAAFIAAYACWRRTQ